MKCTPDNCFDVVRLKFHERNGKVLYLLLTLNFNYGFPGAAAEKKSNELSIHFFIY